VRAKSGLRPRPSTAIDRARRPQGLDACPHTAKAAGIYFENGRRSGKPHDLASGFVDRGRARH